MDPTALRTDLLAQQSRRSQLEEELAAIESELTALGVGLRGSLLDRDGFPRADLDLYRVTAQRQRAAVIRTDLAQLQGDMERSLLLLHGMPEAVKVLEREERHSNAHKEGAPAGAAAEAPFAMVRDVTRDSPAWNAGLRPGLLVTRFGTISRDVGGIPSQVKAGEPVVVRVKATADDAAPVTVLTLTPQRWAGGPGLLGCVVVPFPPASS